MGCEYCGAAGSSAIFRFCAETNLKNADKSKHFSISESSNTDIYGRTVRRSRQSGVASPGIIRVKAPGTGEAGDGDAV